VNLVEPIIHHAARQPDALALVEGQQRIAYRELAALLLRTAGHLAALGVVSGDRVGICLKDSCAHVVSLLAAARLGAVAVPMDWRGRTAEKSRIVKALGLKLVLVEPEEQPLPPAAIFPIDADWHAQVMSAAPPRTLPSDWGAPFLIESSSGSTGLPKFSAVSHLECFLNVVVLFDFTLLPPRRRYLSSVPLFFTAGRRRVIAHLVRGDCVILHPPLLTAEEFVALVDRHRATVTFVVPTMLRQLLRAAPADGFLLPDMEAMTSAGAPLFAQEKLEAINKLTPRLYDCYGATFSGAVAILRPDEIAERPASVGQPHALFQLEIADDAGRPLERGAVGRLRLRGPTLGTEIGSEIGGQAVSEDFRDGWYYPGEIGSLDEQGYLFISSRASEVIIRGGAKINPAEIEAVLQEHSAVAEAAVIGRLSAENEEEVVAFIVARGELTLADILAHCRTRLTAYKIPRDIRIVDRLPRLGSGKIDKRALA
jgi:acyl-CoA synthetase (AMP-forming)/AMP-acid ligase II